MFNALASCFSTVIVIVVATNVVAADPTPVRTMNVRFDADDNYAVISVSDGTCFSELSAVADAATQAGMTKITLSIESKGSDPVPTLVSSNHHIGIQLSATHADLFVSPDVPYEFIQLLSENLRQLPGVSQVLLRSTNAKQVTLKSKRNPDDRFGGFGDLGTTSVAPEAKATESSKPFGN